MTYFAVLLAFILSVLFVKITIVICKKFKLYDEVDPRKIHKGNIPRMGGVGIFLAYAIVVFLYSFVNEDMDFKFGLPILMGFGIIFVFGLIDDIANLNAKFKFFVQILAALAVAVSPVNVHLLLGFELPVWFAKILTFGWIMVCVNAFNLIDGIDWVCSGISLLSVVTIGLVVLVGGGNNYALCFILAGAITGFMVWNKPPAKIFLGDVGSQSLGFAVATFPMLYTHSDSFEYNKITLMILICSIPVTDVIAAIWRRLKNHRSIFSPDRAHIHHKMLNLGFSKKSAISFILITQFFICACAFFSSLMGKIEAEIILIVALFFVELIFITFHYLNRSVNLRNKGKLQDHPQKEY